VTWARVAAVVAAGAVAAALAACPRGAGRDDVTSAPAEPVAEPAPVEIDWPDAGP
jgi:hypothetical protein